MTNLPTADTIETFDSAVDSLLRVKWPADKIAKQLSSKDSYGAQGVTLCWATKRIADRH